MDQTNILRKHHTEKSEQSPCEQVYFLKGTAILMGGDVTDAPFFHQAKVVIVLHHGSDAPFCIERRAQHDHLKAHGGHKGSLLT